MLAPRGLSLALSLGAVTAVIFALTRSVLNLAVVLCVSVPPLVLLAVVLASSWHEPSQRQVARVFDRDLALDERLGTAVEISSAGLAVDGLERVVLAEASAALSISHLSGVRATHTSVQREWLVSACALLTITLLLVFIAARGDSPPLGRLATGNSGRNPATSSSPAKSGGATQGRHLITGRTGNIGQAERRATAPSPTSAGRSSALSVVAQPQTAAAGGRLPVGGGNQHTPAGALSSSGSKTSAAGSEAGTRGTSGGAGGRAGSRTGSGSSAQASTHAAGSAHSGAAGSARGAPSQGHANNPQRVAAGSRAGTFASNRATGSHGSSKAAASGNSQTHRTGNLRSPSRQSAAQSRRSPTGQNHSVGNSAGTGSGGNPFGRPQTTGPRGASAKLPIQAGYTPTHTKSGPKLGNPTGGSGGKGRVRSATESDGGSASAVTLPYIPPSADIGPVDNTLLQNYFSSAPTVSKNW